MPAYCHGFIMRVLQCWTDNGIIALYNFNKLSKSCLFDPIALPPKPSTIPLTVSQAAGHVEGHLQ